MTHITISTENLSRPLTRSDTFDKKLESPMPPSTENIPVSRSITRSETFDKENERVSPPSITKSTDTILSTSIHRSDTFVSKPESSPPPPIEHISSTKSTNIIPTYIENRSDTFISHSEDVSSLNERLPIIDALPINILSSLEQPDIIPIKHDIPLTPRISNPCKAPVDGKHPIKAIYSFLNEARRWAEHTHDITYSNLILSTEEIIQQIPIRKTGVNLRKFPDIDSEILIKASKNQSSNEVCDTIYL